ncbi:MAG: DNA-binding protein [Alphaproteobacteria bacterium]
MSKCTMVWTVNVTPELDDIVTELARNGGVAKSDILQRAIMLMKIASDAKASGKRVGIAALDQPIEREIVGF